MHHTDLSAPPGQPGIQGTETSAGGTGAAVQAVREEAMGQVRSVAETARRETQNVVGEIGTEVRGQVSQQKDRLALMLKDLSAELAEVPPTGSGRVSNLAWDVAGRTGDLSDWLRDHDASDVLRATEDFARRRPLTFLLASAAAGVVVGRLTRGMIDDGDGDSGRGGPMATVPAAATTEGYVPADPVIAPVTPSGPTAAPFAPGVTPGVGHSQPWEGA